MANPSTGFGGAGTEVLRRGYIDGFSNVEATLLTGVANHIYTILSIIFCERAGNAETVDLYLDYDLGGVDLKLLHQQDLPALGTFVFSDRFVITETDKLHVIANGSANIDCLVSYIDQQLA